MSERTFTSWDGTELFYRAWLPGALSGRALILLHRGHEHSGRLEEVVARLGMQDAAVFAWDQRGHGRSPGPRGGAESVAALAKDLDAFARHLCREHGVRLDETVVMAHSVGGVVAAAWVHDYAPPLRGLVLVTPALRVKLYVPLAIPALRLKQRLLGPGHVTSYVKSRVLTHDPVQQAAYDADGQIFRQIAVNLLLDLHDTSKRLVDDAGAITTPTLVVSAGSDWVVRLDVQRTFYERLSSPVKQMEVFPGMYHALLHEKDRDVVIGRARKFIDECFARPAADTSALTRADEGGFTRTEFDRLRAPGCVKWKLARGAMRTFGRLSTGIRLGYASGFDSGATLDYVYENKPRGYTPLGRLIDRNYLNSIGWRGIRQRKENLERLLRRTVRDLHAAGRPVHVVDIAAGAGRYVLETIAAADKEGVPVTATLRDYRQSNLDSAAKLAAELKVSDRVDLVLADAFDRRSIAATSPRPTVGVVSGLYELFPENEPLRRSLAGLADAIEPGGYLLYTCQPWHPQVEFIARVLPNREGMPWVMRRRTQAEMDALVREAGFEKVDQEIDRWGIFTVSLARRC
jgi:alpha-beta hydrolase superfamily lysophospholipase/SAM-dependent methyltransferase